MNRIKELREEINMTQVRLSIELEVAQETISAYEHNKHYPSIASLIKMSEIFHASLDYIMGFSDVRNPVKVLKDDEERLVSTYNMLSPANRALAEAYISGLGDAQRNEEKQL